MEESAQAVAQAVAMAAEAKTDSATRDGAESTPAPAPQDFQHNPAGGDAPVPEAPESTDPAQQRPVTIAPASYTGPTGTSPAVTHPAPGGNLPTCQNCGTHTTPLWRRDENGAVLCNACGLFLKLHNRPRPIHLKTDVIKSRNRIKTHRPDLAKQKKAQAQHLNPQTGDLNGADLGAMNGAAVARRTSQKSNGVLDDTNSPISRTGTPNLYAPHVPMYSNIDDQFQAQQLSAFADGRAASPLGGDIPQTQEQLLATNSSLKTRVSELEVIQELYRGRIQQLEQEEVNLRQQAEKSKSEAEEQLAAQLNALTESHNQLQKELEESHRRENMLKRRLDELEEELKAAKETIEAYEGGRSKKPRVDDGATTEKTENGESPAPQAAAATS
ncbi:hypothetical protein VTJ49DRAFT_2141 [Mycothermus thermophilus]|uniref:GATA-type domain-containing protein n=1 Tax=Humicola insolens TaxID=85995 RepID=A0ABR3VN47_HUMIN